jgi:hypothetical protein
MPSNGDCVQPLQLSLTLTLSLSLESIPPLKS